MSETKYPGALAIREDFVDERGRKGERGFTFLKRILAENIRTGQPVIFRILGNYFEYDHRPRHKTFWDGSKFLEGDEFATLATDRLKETALKYDINRGLAQIGDVKEVGVDHEPHRQGFLSRLRFLRFVPRIRV